jgi:hypothetical protein
MARALHCPIFKHQPPRQSGCGLAQLCKDLSTPLGTGIGDTPVIRFRHAEEANPKKMLSQTIRAQETLSNSPTCTPYKKIGDKVQVQFNAILNNVKAGDAA